MPATAPPSSPDSACRDWIAAQLATAPRLRPEQFDTIKTLLTEQDEPSRNPAKRRRGKRSGLSQEQHQ